MAPSTFPLNRAFAFVEGCQTRRANNSLGRMHMLMKTSRSACQTSQFSFFVGQRWVQPHARLQSLLAPHVLNNLALQPFGWLPQDVPAEPEREAADLGGVHRGQAQPLTH